MLAWRARLRARLSAMVLLPQAGPGEVMATRRHWLACICCRRRVRIRSKGMASLPAVAVTIWLRASKTRCRGKARQRGPKGSHGGWVGAVFFGRGGQWCGCRRGAGRDSHVLCDGRGPCAAGLGGRACGARFGNGGLDLFHRSSCLPSVHAGNERGNSPDRPTLCSRRSRSRSSGVI
jgi:hypothetical protein